MTRGLKTDSGAVNFIAVVCDVLTQPQPGTADLHCSVSSSLQQMNQTQVSGYCVVRNVFRCRRQLAAMSVLPAGTRMMRYNRRTSIERGGVYARR